jgi:2Fe-2S ferredoxin
MVAITFEGPGGRVQVDAEVGRSLMSVAVEHGIVGIEGACGGSLACGTCHAYIAEPYFSALPTADAVEAEMLEYGVHIEANSRLLCQINVAPALEGLVVHVPVSQR